MTDPAKQPPKTRRKWKRVFAGVLALLFVTLGLFVLIVYLRFANPEYVRAMAEAYIQEFTHGRVEVGSADFSWLEGVQLFDVVVHDVQQELPPGSGGAGEAAGEVVFSCKRLRLDANLLAGVFGKLHIKSVVAIEPRCLVVRDGADGKTNLAKLINPEAFGGFDGSEDVPVPAIELRDAHIRVVNRQDGRDRIVDEQTLTIRARPLRRDSRYYDIVWRGGGGARTAQGRSQVDLRTGRLRNVHGGLPWMSLEAVMSVVNAQNPEVGAWSDLLGLDGAVRATDYDFGGGPDGAGSRSATVELAHATLSIPINDQESALPSDERYLRFEDVLGTITLTAQGIDAKFAGQFHGSPCDVRFQMTGAMDQITTLDDVDFSAQVVVRDLTLPHDDPQSHPSHHRFVNSWPPIRKFYRDFRPWGVVDVEIDVEKRAGAENPIPRRVRLVAKGAGATYRKFPYAVEQLQGVVEFTPDGVFIKDLEGLHGEGRIVTAGWLSAPRRNAAVDLTFTGRRILIEEALIAALPGGFRRIHDRFDLSGRVDATVRLQREASEPGVSAPWHITTDVEFDGLSAMYAGFPLPATALTGGLRVDGNTLEIRDTTAQIGGGLVTLAAQGDLDQGRVETLDVSLKGRDLVFSDELLGALPEGVQDWARRFQPSGRFGIDLQLAQAEGQWSYAADIALHDVTVVPDELAVPVEDVNGVLRLRGRRIEIDGMKGRYGDAQLVASALIDRDGDRKDEFLKIEGRGLVIDHALHGVLPDEVQSLLATWRVEGPIDVDVEVRNGERNEDQWNDVRVLARLKDAVVRHDRFPLPFEHVTAEVVVDGHGVRGSGIRARYGDSAVGVSFEATKSDGVEEGRIEIDALGLSLDDSLRDVFPESVRRVWDRVGFSGRADVHLHPLAYRCAEKGAPTVWSVGGTLDLIKVSLSSVASMEDLQGTLTVEGTLVDRMGGTLLHGELENASLRVFNRVLTDVSTPWSHVQMADGQGRFSLDDVHGLMYDGILTSRTEINFDAQETRYDVSGAVHGVDIKKFLAVDRESAPAGSKRPKVSGRADASLTLVGVVGTPASRKGTGRIEVTKGELFRMPLIAAVLNFINLTLPPGPSTDQAEANFLVLGSRLKLDDIYFEGRGLAFAGSGVFSLPDKGLDLNLASLNPNENMRVPGLSDAVEAAMGKIVELHVTGPLHHPRVVARPFPGIGNELKRLFKKKKAKKMQATSR